MSPVEPEGSQRNRVETVVSNTPFQKRLVTAWRPKQGDRYRPANYAHVTESYPSNRAPGDGASQLALPERAHLVTAIGAIYDDDPLGAAVALQTAIDVSSREIVGRRIEIAVRALTLDADLEVERGQPGDMGSAELDGLDPHWAALWRSLYAVADLADRAGYPPEVLAV